MRLKISSYTFYPQAYTPPLVDRTYNSPYNMRFKFEPERNTLLNYWISNMKVLSSLKSAKNRHKDCQIVRRRGKVYVINKTNPRFKARQK
ncbi:hypothetical protein JCM17795_05940 [Galenea microaerophila]